MYKIISRRAFDSKEEALPFLSHVNGMYGLELEFALVFEDSEKDETL